MSRRTVRLCVLAWTVLAGVSAFAAEGRTPIFLPGSADVPAGGTIVADGKYILTRNLTSAEGPLITICSSDVDLDLNGMLVLNTGETPTIAVGAPYCQGKGDAADHARIHNGTLKGGQIGIYSGAVRKIDIEDVKIHDTLGDGIGLDNGTGIPVIRRTEIIGVGGVGISIYGQPTEALGRLVGGPGPAPPKSGTIEHNVIVGCAFGGMYLQGSSFAVLNNHVEQVGGTGIALFGYGASLVAQNTVTNVTAGDGILIGGQGCKVLDNVVTRCSVNGIYLAGASNTLVVGNVSSGNGISGPAGDGIRVEGNGNVVRGNVVNSNSGVGLHFVGYDIPDYSCGNTYGGNTARGNFGTPPGTCAAPPAGQAAPDFCDWTTDCTVPNSSHGENLMPGPPLG